jgi:hypothetical protein
MHCQIEPFLRIPDSILTRERGLRNIQLIPRLPSGFHAWLVPQRKK